MNEWMIVDRAEAWVSTGLTVKTSEYVIILVQLLCTSSCGWLLERCKNQYEFDSIQSTPATLPSLIPRLRVRFVMYTTSTILRTCLLSTLVSSLTMRSATSSLTWTVKSVSRTKAHHNPKHVGKKTASYD